MAYIFQVGYSAGREAVNFGGYTSIKSELKLNN